jgi:hypothetical protein
MMRSHSRTSLTSAAAGGLFVLALGLAACSSETKETAAWKSPSYAAGPMKNIAVFGGRLDEANRRVLEDGFVTELAAYGVHAVPSYSMFPDGMVPQDQTAVREALQKGGYDGVLVSTFKGVKEQAFAAPGSDWNRGFYSAFWGPGPAEPGTSEYVKFETTLWDPNGGNLVWSTNTRTKDPSLNKNFASNFTHAVVPPLSQAGLIPPKSGQPVSLER